MAFEMKDMSGSIFRNEEKTKETDRDYSGDGMVDGRAVWISGWVNEAKSGKKYLKLTFKYKDEQPQRVAPRKADPITSGRNADMNDDIPF